MRKLITGGYVGRGTKGTGKDTGFCTHHYTRTHIRHTRTYMAGLFYFHFSLFVYLVTSYLCDIVTITALPNTTTTTATATTIIRHKYEPQGGRTRNT